jgi:glutamate/tyrosine decarboxylase-like PLP-dependent enzyme
MGYFGEGQDLVFSGPVFPAAGKSKEDVEARLNELYGLDAGPVDGHVMLYSMTLMDTYQVNEVSRAAFSKFMKKNMLSKELAPGLQTLERELKRMVVEILGDPDETRVNITSGGSESLYCAINAAVQWAKVNKPKVTRPEVIVPYSIHAAFSKWAHFTGIKLTRVPLAPDYRADVAAMERAITPDTVMIAGSAPCWPYGLYDPIEELAAVARRHDLWMHTDACLGGFLAPWVEKLGYRLPTKWGFDVPGVCSVSADLHKYGYTAKPCSTILYKNKELQQFHWCHPSDWPSGPYRTEAILGTFPAGSVASAWAVMMYLGEKGYLDLARRTLEVRQRYIAGINAIDGLRCWDNDLTPLVIDTGDIDFLSFIAGLFERNKFVYPVYEPPLVQFICAPVTDEVVDGFIAAAAEVAKGVREGKITAEFLARYV